MAIKDDNKGPSANTTNMGAAMGNAQNRQAPPQQPNFTMPPSGGNAQPQWGNAQSQQPAGRGFASLGGDVLKAIPLSTAGEALSRTTTAMQDIVDGYKGDTSPVNVTLIPVDKNDGAAYGIQVSYIIVATQLKSNPEAGIGYQSIILDASIDPLAPVEEFVPNVPGGKVEVIRTVADVDSADVREKIHNIVCQQFNTNKVFSALGMVLPREFNLDDVASVKYLTAKAAYAASVELQRHNGLKPLNLVEVVGGGDTLVTNLSFDSRPIKNLVGLPVRSDMKLELQSVPVNKQPNNTFGAVATTSLARISAYLDVVYQPEIPPGTMTAPSYMGQVNPAIYRKFLGRVNLTDLTAERLTTLEGQLLALAAAIGMRNGGAWMGTLVPRRDLKPDEIDLHDVGDLNIEVNFNGDPTQVGIPIDTKADSFTTGNLMTYVRAIFQDGVVFSIDVSERGGDTWYNGVLAAVDAGDVDAYNAVIAGANNLTNGNFAKHFPVGSKITLAMNERIHNGYYKNRFGELRDIRDVDLRAMYALFGKSKLQLVHDFSDTYTQTDYPELQRLAARARIIREVTTNAVFTGFSQRVTFGSVFTDALVAGIADTKTAMPLVAPFLDTSTQQRGVGNFGAGLNSNATSPLYTRQSPGGGQQQAFNGQQFVNKWGN